MCLLRRLDSIRTIFSISLCTIWVLFEGLVGVRFGWILALLQLILCVLQGLKSAAQKPKAYLGKISFLVFLLNVLENLKKGEIWGQIRCVFIREPLT